MAEALRLFILAGEPSGDQLGADLVRRLRERCLVDVQGVGGDAMAGQGLSSLFPMSELSVMGWRDVLPRLPRLLWRVGQVARAILRNRPDMVVLIDSQVFSRLVAQRVRKGGGTMAMVLYVAPAVWAWKPERAAALKPLFDAVMAVLPFEPAAMRQFGGPTTRYVGHPALETIAMRSVQPARGPMLLLPGSRTGQLHRHLPLMGHVAKRLQRHPRVTGFAILAPTHLRAEVEAAVRGWPVAVSVADGNVARGELLADAVAATAITGTVTLELALAGVPMVTTYLGDAGQARRFKRYGVRFAALPNVVLERTVVPEILMERPEPERLAAAMERLLDDEPAMALQRSEFRALRQIMERGAPGETREDPAEQLLYLLR